MKVNYHHDRIGRPWVHCPYCHGCIQAWGSGVPKFSPPKYESYDCPRCHFKIRKPEFVKVDEKPRFLLNKDGPYVISIRWLGTEPGIKSGYKPMHAHTSIGLILRTINEMIHVFKSEFKENAENNGTEPHTFLRANIAAYLLRTFAKPEVILDMSKQIDKPLMDLAFGNIPLTEEEGAVK